MALYFSADSGETELDHNCKVSKLKARWCMCGNEEYGYFDPLIIPKSSADRSLCPSRPQSAVLSLSGV
eukprot:1913795-Rhodomonas_salina.1